MTLLKQYWPSIAHVLVVLVAFLTPSVQAFAASHLAYSGAVLLVWGVVLHHLPSPLAK
jgi:hypothetical protein